MNRFETYNPKKMTDDAIYRLLVWRGKRKWWSGVMECFKELDKRYDYRHMIRP